MTKSIGFYPGCSLEGSSHEYNESVTALAALFDIELRQVPDWNCCGASAAHNLNRDLALALPARILALAAAAGGGSGDAEAGAGGGSAAGMERILVPCAACYNRLAVTAHELSGDSALRARIEEVIGMPMGNIPRIMNVIEFIEEFIVPELPSKMVKEFPGPVACYYGCLLVRPHEILKFDRLEDPQSMDSIMTSLGAQCIEWPMKTECCGAALSVMRTPLAARLSGRIVGDAVERGAKAIIVACPMCHSNLDLRRGAINKALATGTAAGAKTDIPVLYITQAIGVACGLDDRQTGTRRHMVRVDWKRLAQMKQTNEEG